MSNVHQLNADRLQRELADHRIPARVENIETHGTITRYTVEPCMINREAMREVAAETGVAAWAICRATFKVIKGVVRVVFLMVRQ